MGSDPRDKSRSGERRRQRWLTTWVPHRLELLISPPWQQAPMPLRRLLERIEIEHLRHGGLNNGQLFISYDQFVATGISRKTIKPVQRLGEALGLLEVIQWAEPAGNGLRHPNAYRLTYVPAKGKAAPSDEWKHLTADRAERLVEAFKGRDRTTSASSAREAA